MRPRKHVLLYHPNEDAGSILRYAIGTSLLVIAHLAKSRDQIPGEKIEVAVRWTETCIEIENFGARTFRTLPLTVTNLEIMEGLRIGLARKRGPRYARKDREDVKAGELESRVKLVTENIAKTERMLEIAFRKKGRAA